jgi:adenine-specific DNA-methyltransferase
MERDKELYERQVRIVDAQIDRLVYDLYGLTEEEVRVVEKA